MFQSDLGATFGRLTSNIFTSIISFPFSRTTYPHKYESSGVYWVRTLFISLTGVPRALHLGQWTLWQAQ
jgi:hypothetical protein